jgi:hypothetical protein
MFSIAVNNLVALTTWHPWFARFWWKKVKGKVYPKIDHEGPEGK